MSRQGYTVQEAAEVLGVSEKTVRRRLRGGELEGEKVPGQGGYVWRVYIDHPDGQASDRVDRESTQTVQALLELVREKDTRIEALQREKLDLAGQLGMFTERVRNLNERILLLEAPKEPPRRPWWRFWEREASAGSRAGEG